MRSNSIFEGFALALILSLAMVTGAFSADQESQDPDALAKKINSNLHYQHGLVKIGNGKASLNLTSDFRYLDPKQSKSVLEQLWGNPPGGETLGMLFPADQGPLDPSSWAIVITLDESGYVKDDDAESINYSNLLKEMQESTKARSRELAKDGYAPVNLVGWAEPPHYDKTAHKLYWAKELQFGDSPNHQLNYDIRVLGRKGVLVLTAVASIETLPQIKQSIGQVLSFTDFSAGSRYTDFNASTDKVAAYGIAALVAGGVAAKAGFFKGLLIALVAAKKLVVAGIFVVIAYLKSFFSKKKENSQQAS